MSCLRSGDFRELLCARRDGRRRKKNSERGSEGENGKWKEKDSRAQELLMKVSCLSLRLSIIAQSAFEFSFSQTQLLVLDQPSTSGYKRRILSSSRLLREENVGIGPAPSAESDIGSHCQRRNGKLSKRRRNERKLRRGWMVLRLEMTKGG